MINHQYEQLGPFSFFQNLEEEYEYVKAKVQSKELIAKEDIQEFLVNPTRDISMYKALFESSQPKWKITYNSIPLSTSRKKIFPIFQNKGSSQSMNHGENMSRIKEDYCNINL